MIAQLVVGAPFIVGPLVPIGLSEWRDHRRWVSDSRPDPRWPECSPQR